MAKDQNTYAKRARETAKKRKADAKRERRRKKKEQADQINPATDADIPHTDQQTTGDQSQQGLTPAVERAQTSLRDSVPTARRHGG